MESEKGVALRNTSGLKNVVKGKMNAKSVVS